MESIKGALIKKNTGKWIWCVPCGKIGLQSNHWISVIIRGRAAYSVRLAVNKYFCYAFSDHLFVNYQSKESCDIQDSLAAAKAQKDACKASISLCKVNAVSRICFAFSLKLINKTPIPPQLETMSVVTGCQAKGKFSSKYIFAER